MSAVISFDKVSFAYGHIKVLEDICLDIEAEEFFGVIGPNGAGKSTMLKLMLGTLKPDKGKISVLGKSPKQSCQHIGYVPQTPSFPRNFPINVMDVVLMGCMGKSRRMGGFSKRDREIALESLRVVEIADLVNVTIENLSGGQVQRMLIARALASEPEILILDEPTANIDVQAEENIFSLLTQYNEHMTIIVVSHDIAFISGYVNRVGCLNTTLLCHKTEAISGKTIEELYGAPVKMIHHAH
ncbi:MAG: zinc transport system ATP-binding protein [Gammaproteobacteria bacterium]|jgi:zinc transport system ATP-binding protein